MRLGAQPCEVVAGLARAPDLRLDHASPSGTAIATRSTTTTCRGWRRRASRSARGRKSAVCRRPLRDDRAAGPPVVLRLPVPPRVHVESAARPSAVHRLRARGARAQAAQRGRGRAAPSGLVARMMCPHAHIRSLPPRGATCLGAPGGRSDAMKLCGFEVGLDRPLFLIAGPCVVESLQLQIDVAGRLKEICAELRHPVHLQVLVRQGQPQLGRLVPRPGDGRGPRASSPR